MNFQILGILMVIVLGGLLLFSKSWSKKEKSTSQLEVQYTEALNNYLVSKSDIDLQQLNTIANKYWSMKGKSEDEIFLIMKNQKESLS